MRKSIAVNFFARNSEQVRQTNALSARLCIAAAEQNWTQMEWTDWTEQTARIEFCRLPCGRSFRACHAHFRYSIYF